MSEILFNGKRTDNGEWVEGALFKSFSSDNAYIMQNCKLDETEKDYDLKGFDCLGYVVDPKTIGQYTLRKDINDNKIWENNIVRYFEIVENRDYNSPCFVESKGIYEPRRTRHIVEFIAVVRFDEELSMYVVNPIYCTEYINYERRRLGEYPMENIEVVGNIFDDNDIDIKSLPGLHIKQDENGRWELWKY